MNLFLLFLVIAFMMGMSPKQVSNQRRIFTFFVLAIGLTSLYYFNPALM